MRAVSFFIGIIQHAFRCRHSKASLAEGKTYCPDCGEGILCRWIVIRCNACQHRRAGKYWFREVVPAESCCIFCGEKNFSTQYLHEPEFFQLRYALLSFESDKEKNYSFYQVKVFVTDLIKGLTAANDIYSEHELKRLPSSALSF